MTRPNNSCLALMIMLIVAGMAIFNVEEEELGPKHKLHTVYTAHHSYNGPNKVDISANGKHIDWHHFAPTWAMINSVKNVTPANKAAVEQKYVDDYLVILNHVPMRVWDLLFQKEEVVFTCYCREEWFCHRNILVRRMKEILQERLRYGGFIK